ncbi:hypothetical protein EW145_g5896 [Phellinidium pouzarii]|uniref:HMG box domain-containing protein n=1 Tax=Phellinidium pouzarii TaxID=167371 RepID=A0A4S4KYE0_9AGAM|nr:hypothetical protein EW145_g5896 [Phellinidium pouzarii]
MPAIRSGCKRSHRDLQQLSIGVSKAKSTLSLILPVPAPASSSPKRKKTRNAFILFRSHLIANKILPASATHQNDVSRLAGVLWHEQDKETVDYFYRRAEEERQRRLAEDGGFEIVKREGTRHPAQKTPVAQLPTPPSSPYSSTRTPAKSGALISSCSPGSSSGGDISPLSYPVTPLDAQPKDSFLEPSRAVDNPPPSPAPLKPEVKLFVNIPEPSHPSVYNGSIGLPSLSHGSALGLLINPSTNEKGLSTYQLCANMLRHQDTLAPAPARLPSSIEDSAFMEAFLDLTAWGDN